VRLSRQASGFNEPPPLPSSVSAQVSLLPIAAPSRVNVRNKRAHGTTAWCWMWTPRPLVGHLLRCG
jgi:hypothetical protein